MKLLRAPACLCLSASLTLLAGCGSTPPAAAPGVPQALLDPAVTPDNVQQTICRLGYVESVTPSDAQTANMKRQQLLRAGTELAVSGTYVLDRVVPISLGGHPTHDDNLQLLDLGGNHAAARKQALERRLHQLVCAGKIGLREAQASLVPDWLPAYDRFVLGEETKP
jgi:hypothetical protein